MWYCFVSSWCQLGAATWQSLILLTCSSSFNADVQYIVVVIWYLIKMHVKCEMIVLASVGECRLQ